MNTTRTLIPVVLFGAVTAYCAACGLYDASLCVHAILTRSVTAWNDFLGAELFLLVGWSFWKWTRISLAVRRDTVRMEQVRVKGGVAGRVAFLVATLAAVFGYIMSGFLLDFYSVGRPWWFRHFGHGIIAVLIFCTFTYPWRRHARMTPNKSPEPTAVGAVSSADAVHVASRRWLSFLR